MKADPSVARLRFNRFELDGAEARLTCDGKPIALAPKPFWLRPDLIQTTNTASERDATIVLDRRYPEKIWRQLNQQGFTYLLLDPTSSPDKDPMLWKPSWASVETLYRRDKWQVYRVRFDAAQGPARLTTREVSPGAWEVVPSGQDSTAR